MKIDRSDKKSKWTVMKYVSNFNLLVKYASLVRDLKARVDDESIMKVNSIKLGGNIAHIQHACAGDSHSPSIIPDAACAQERQESGGSQEDIAPFARLQAV